MINEQEIIFKYNPKEIFHLLSEEKDEIHLEDIIINYYGDRQNLKNNYKNKNKKDLLNSLLFINYKEIYIGGVSISNLNQREKFGLNKYSENSFYLGQWKNNSKHGTGFLKINENVMYMGTFENNQINEFGMLFYKEEETLYFGNFIEGKYDDGLCYNQKNGTFYRGKIKDGKRHDKFCTFFDANNGHLFIGEVEQDNFIKGYLGICEITKEKGKSDEEQEEEIINFKLQKIVYFDKSDKNKKMKIIHCYMFTPEFYEGIQDYMNKIFQADFNLKDQSESIIDYFNSFDNYVNDRDYIDYIIKYNQVDEEESLENYFLRDYQEYYERFENGQKVFDLDNYIDILGPPKINQEN